MNVSDDTSLDCARILGSSAATSFVSYRLALCQHLIEVANVNEQDHRVAKRISRIQTAAIAFL